MPNSPSQKTRADLEVARRGHLERAEAAATRLGAHTVEFKDRKPTSFTKVDNVRVYILSDNYDPDIAEQMVAAVSAAGTAQAIGVSVKQGDIAEKKSHAHKLRNELLKAIALIIEQKKPHYRGKRRIDFIRELIVEALDARDGLQAKCELDEWFKDSELYDDQLLRASRKGDGTVIGAGRIANILTKVK